MKYRALVSFVGRISMRKGEVREIQDENLAKSLLQPKFIEEVEEEKTKVEEKTAEIKEIKKPIIEEEAIIEEKPVVKKKNKKNK